VKIGQVQDAQAVEGARQAGQGMVDLAHDQSTGVALMTILSFLPATSIGGPRCS
jgi:hypothetical protein